MYKNLSLYCLIILFSSCNKAIVNGQSNNQGIAPPSNFISEIKQLNTSEKDDEFIYDFTETNFRKFKPITKENIFIEYANIFNLTKDFEMKFLSKTTAKKNRHSEELYQVEKYRPYYKGISLDWNEVIVYYNKERVAKVFAYFPADLDLDISKRLTEEEAKDLLIQYLKSKDYYYWDKAGFKPELSIRKRNLVYSFVVMTFEPNDTKRITINAQNGEIIRDKTSLQRLTLKNNFTCNTFESVKNVELKTINNTLVCDCSNSSFNTTGVNVQTILNGNKTITIDKCQDDDLYILFDEGTPLPAVNEPIRAINIIDFLNQTSIPLIKDFEEYIEWCEPDFNNMSDIMKNEANSYFSTEFVYNFYLQNHSVNSFDNMGSSIKLALHDVSNPMTFPPTNTALWNEDGDYIQLGDGVQNECNLMGSVEIVAHELTHGYLNNHFSLDSDDYGNQNELYWSTNALHEALADIIGTIIHYRSDNSPSNINWSFGSTSCSNYNPLPRLLNNPQAAAIPQAAYYEDPNFGWSSSSNDIYNRAGVISHWFYLLTDGGTGVQGDAVNGVGIDKSESILFSALNLMRGELMNLTPQNKRITFEEFRDYTLDAVQQVFGSCSDEHRSVSHAWRAVGLLDCGEGEEVNCEDEKLEADIQGGSGCFSYEWQELIGGDFQVIPNENSKELLGADCSNIYKVVITDVFFPDCVKEAIWMTTSINTINNNDLVSLQVFPNPVNSVIKITLNSSQNLEDVSLEVFGVNGKKLKSSFIQKNINTQLSLDYDISNLSSGVYFIKVTSAIGITTKKFVKL